MSELREFSIGLEHSRLVSVVSSNAGSLVFCIEWRKIVHRFVLCRFVNFLKFVPYNHDPFSFSYLNLINRSFNMH